MTLHKIEERAFWQLHASGGAFWEEETTPHSPPPRALAIARQSRITDHSAKLAFMVRDTSMVIRPFCCHHCHRRTLFKAAHGCQTLRHRLGHEPVQHPGAPRGHLYVGRMADAVEDV